MRAWLLAAILGAYFVLAALALGARAYFKQLQIEAEAAQVYIPRIAYVRELPEFTYRSLDRCEIMRSRLAYDSSALEGFELTVDCVRRPVAAPLASERAGR